MFFYLKTNHCIGSFSAVSSLEAKASGKIGAVTMALILGTQIIGVIQGIIFTVAVHPGTNLGGEVPKSKGNTKYGDIFADLLR